MLFAFLQLFVLMQGNDAQQQQQAEPAADLNAFFAKRDKKKSAPPVSAGPVAVAAPKPVKDERAAASRGPALVNLAQVKTAEKVRAAWGRPSVRAVVASRRGSVVAGVWASALVADEACDGRWRKSASRRRPRSPAGAKARRSRSLWSNSIRTRRRLRARAKAPGGAATRLPLLRRVRTLTRCSCARNEEHAQACALTVYQYDCNCWREYSLFRRRGVHASGVCAAAEVVHVSAAPWRSRR